MQEAQEPLSQEGTVLHRTVLVVEDDAHIGAFLIEAITQETPHHAILVPTGAEALQVVQQVKPELLILDFHLPGMNGLELYDHIHAIPGLQQVPAIMMSARLPRAELEKRAIIGINKPFELDDFLQTVHDLLG